VVGCQVQLGALVQGVLDVNGASPRRFFFEVLQHFASSQVEAERLQYFATPEGREDLYIYNQREGRTLLEVLQVRAAGQAHSRCTTGRAQTMHGCQTGTQCRILHAA
jgi:sulfite reductase alpha subunit-like flavoprotein